MSDEMESDMSDETEAKGAGDGGRIDQAYYDGSDYHRAGADHLVDLESPFQRYRVQKVLQIFEPTGEDRVIDMGCGWGTFCFALGHRVKEMVGVDFSQKSIDFCEAEAARRKLKGLRFLRADARDTGLPQAAYDLIIAADFFEHIYAEDTVLILHECRRLLRKGGRLAIWTPHRGHFLEILKNHNIILKADPTHVDYKSMPRLKKMVSDAGFLVEKAYFAESHLPVLSGLERALLPIVPPLRRRIALLGIKE
jgi:cyclopropane fatty-acyl-phospholipid synthase-like methyltransferase